MHAVDMMTYGHQTIADAVTGLAESDWNTAGVCGHWSVKEIMAHLASYELLLVEVLYSLTDSEAKTPLLETMFANDKTFNDDEVERRAGLTAVEQWQEYEAAHKQALALLKQIPLEGQRLSGVLSWYGEAYDLEDFLVYMYYAHKREHAAQIHLFWDHLAQQTEMAERLLAGVE